MVDLELFNPASRVLGDCLKFCFIGVLCKELKEMAEVWNEHVISKSSNGGPSGRPDTMYFLPHLFNCQDYSDPLEDDDIDESLPPVEEISTDYSADFCEKQSSLVDKSSIEFHCFLKLVFSIYHGKRRKD